MRRAERKRQEFILDHIQERAEINRSDLIAEFGISVPQASHDLKTFQEANPGMLVYDKSRKRYVAPTFFVLEKPTPLGMQRARGILKNAIVD